MRYLPLILLLAPLTASALDVILRIDGEHHQTIKAERAGLTVFDGRMVFDIKTAPSTPQPPAPPPPTEPPPVVPPTACSPFPARSIINTGSMTERFKQTVYNPAPSTILSFRFTTPAAGNHHGRASATRTTSSPHAKTLVISECPGDHKNPVTLSNACIQSGVEVTQVTFTTNPNADQRFECVLKHGKAYYVNAVSIPNFGSTSHSCTNPTDCGFYFVRDPS